MIYIRKSGIFYENDYKPDSDEYIFTKVKSIVPYLNEVIHIDSGITLEDIFLILEKDEDIVEIIFGSHMGHFPLRPYIDEIKNNCLPEGREELEHIECSWVSEQFDYKVFYENNKNSDLLNELVGELRKPDDEVNDITIYVDVYGWGKFEPQEDEIYEKGEEPPTHVGHAIEFTPLYRLKHLPIKLNKKFVMKEERYDGSEVIVVTGEKEFSVFQVFGAILSELTFAGLPDDRDKKWEQVSDEIKEHREKLEEEEDEEENQE